jgi:demethylmenaquinone methyltransferase/2-methoxy-6-polyprenyl-1,4-benzoquinol methylase
MAEEPTGGCKRKGAFEDAYRNAAAAGSAVISDSTSGIRVDHTKYASMPDPTKPLRERVAARVARSVRDVQNPKCIDVACSMGSDLGLLAAALGDKPAQLFGLDLLEAQLEHARLKLPGASFTQGDVLALPFLDAEFDSVQASRLLVHLADFRKAIDEMLRIMKPGATGVFCEADMDSSLLLYTSDERLRSVFQKKHDFVAKMLSNPCAASGAYRYLLSHADAEDVSMESFSVFLPEPTCFDPEMQMDRQMLQKIVTNGDLTQDDVDYYLAEAVGRSAKEGNFLQHCCGPVEIHFRKKR